MALLSSILGFSLFGLGARIGQLGIQKRNLFESASSFPSLSTSSSRNITRLSVIADSSFLGHVFMVALAHLSVSSSSRADPGGHIISMLAFGYVGYWAHRWDERAGVLIAEKRAEIAERRGQRIARAEAASAAALAEAS